MTPSLAFSVQLEARDDSMTPRAGLPLALGALRKFGLEEMLTRLLPRRGPRGSPPWQKALDLILMLIAGGDRIADIEPLRADLGLTRLLGRGPASESALLTFLHGFHDDALIEQARARLAPGAKACIPDESGKLKALGQANIDFIRRIGSQLAASRATLELDASIVESSKQEATAHYKEGRGYQPVFVTWAETDLIVHDQFRDGNVPAGMGNLPIIQRSFAALPKTVTERLLRADSACYETPVLAWLNDEQRKDGPQGPIGFTISADMSVQLRAKCEALHDAKPGTQEATDPGWRRLEERAHELVDVGEVEFTTEGQPKTAVPLRYIVLRLTPRQLDLTGQSQPARYLAVVTNRHGLSHAGVVRWHWRKAGGIELVHDVLKNELGLGVLPCGRFGANAAWSRLNVLAHNLLSAMKQLLLPASLEAARPKKLRYLLFNIAGRIVSHANKLVLRVSADLARLVGLDTAYAELTRVT